MESEDESGERLNAPWVLENNLGICNVHTELVAEALFDIIGYFLELLMCP